MTALSADLVVQSKNPGIRSYKMADSVHIYKGSIVCIDPATGYANPGANTSGYVTVGIAEENVDNTLTGHTAGGKRIRVLSGAHFLLNNVGATFAQTSVGANAYVTDSGNVSLSETNSVLAGIITEYVSTTSAWVFVGDVYPLGTATISGLTATATELNTLHSVTAGTVSASKAVVVDANKRAAGLQRGVTDYSADGAITISDGIVTLSKSSAAAMTLAAPSSAQEGLTLTITAKTAQAHVITCPSNLFNAATNNTATFGGAIGDSIVLVAVNQNWNVISTKNVSLSHV